MHVTEHFVLMLCRACVFVCLGFFVVVIGSSVCLFSLFRCDQEGMEDHLCQERGKARSTRSILYHGLCLFYSLDSESILCLTVSIILTYFIISTIS